MASAIFDNAFGALRDTLGEKVTLTPIGGSGETGKGIFSVDPDPGVEVEGVRVTMPELGLAIRLADFTTPPQQGSRATVRGVEYVVEDVREDGHGSAMLQLKRP